MSQSSLDIDVTTRQATVMSFENMLSKMGSGMKHLTDRYTEYEAPVQDPHLLYGYEPPVPPHEVNSKHSYNSSSKNNAAMSALTLLAFLFFLHILQQCIKDHMASMSAPQITIMTAGREGEDVLNKEKIDKTGVSNDEIADVKDVDNDAIKTSDKKYLTKINTAQPPKYGVDKHVSKVYDDRKIVQTGFVNAMDDDF